MKLYTEEQVREAILIAVDIIASEKTWTLDDVIDKVNSIELPSDKEILKTAKECVYEDLDISVASFELGARWYREQIKNQQQ